MPRLAVAGYYGFGNAGDEAILESIILALRSEVPSASFSVLTNDPAGTRAAHGVDAVPRFSPPAVLRAIQECDLLVFGGGSLLQDATSLRSLFYYLSILLAAQALGKPTMVYANGVGPLRSRIGALATKLVLRRVSAITLRDSDSAEQLRAIGVDRPEPVVTADPVFALEPEDASKARAILRSEGIPVGASPLVGMSLRPCRNAPRLAAVAAEACDAVSSALGATVVLLPMQHSHDDPLAESVAASTRRPVAVLRRRCAPRELMACIGLMDALIGMRLHSLIFAVAMGVPSAGVAYDPKVAAFLDAAGCPSLGAPEDLAPAKVVDSARRLLEDADGLKLRLATAGARFRSLALENARIARSLLASAR